MHITIDFDNTLFVDEYPEVGRPVPYAKEILMWLAEQGHVLTVSTCREGEELEKAVVALDNAGMSDFIDTFNEWPQYIIEYWNKDCRKIVGDINIDDRNVGIPKVSFEGTRVVDWVQVERMLIKEFAV